MHRKYPECFKKVKRRVKETAREFQKKFKKVPGMSREVLSKF